MEQPLLIPGTRREVVSEVEKQVRLAGPLMLSSVLQFSLNVISIMFVGQLGELPLAGAAMATSFAGVTGFSFLVLSLSLSLHRALFIPKLRSPRLMQITDFDLLCCLFLTCH